jgi:hypothetical protein
MTSPSPRFLVYTFLTMGRQTRFHMLPEDCRRFLLFLQERDPVIVTEWYSSELAEIQEVNRPWERGGALLFVESGDPPCVGTESYRETFQYRLFGACH